MPEVLFPFFPFVLFIIFTAHYLYQKRKIKQILKDTAIALNLNTDFGVLGSKQYVSGRYDGIDISIRAATENKQEYFIMTSKHKLIDDTRFKLVPRSWSKILFGALEYGKFTTQDDRFDRSIMCTTNRPVTLTALLNEPIRQKILTLNNFAYDLSTKNDCIVARRTISNVNDCKTLIMIIYELIAISKDFSRNNNVKQRLIQNFNTDKNQAIRLKNLQHLIRQFERDDQIESVLKSALADNHLEIMFEAAKYMDIEGMQHLKRMLTKSPGMKREQIIEIVKFFGKRKFTESMDVLVILCRTYMNKELRIEILKAFKEFGQTGISDFILTQLDVDDSQVQIAAIEALGTCGTIESIEKLYLLAKHSLNLFIRNAVQKSIAQIQSRAGNGEKGWLSVSELADKEGALSMDTEKIRQ